METNCFSLDKLLTGYDCFRFYMCCGYMLSCANVHVDLFNREAALAQVQVDASEVTILVCLNGNCKSALCAYGYVALSRRDRDRDRDRDTLLS